MQEVYEQLVEREKRVKGQEASVSTALGERERSLQTRQDQLAAELQERERRLRGHEDECLATDRQLTADKAALDRARQVALPHAGPSLCCCLLHLAFPVIWLQYLRFSLILHGRAQAHAM